MGSEQALSFVLSRAILLLGDAIKYGATWRGVDGSPAACLAFRRSMAIVLNAMPLCSTSLRDEARQHEAADAVLFYERVRGGLGQHSHFLNGVPASIDLCSDPPPDTETPALAAEVQKLRLKQLVEFRLRQVTAIEELALHPPHMPTRVHMLISRCRALHRAVREVRAAGTFSCCANQNCGRTFYVGQDAELWSMATSQVLLTPLDSDEASTQAAYWQATAGELWQPPSATARQFCCSACADEYERHLQACMPECGNELDVDAFASKQGRPRVMEAFEMVLRRNSLAARSLRDRPLPRRRCAVAERDIVAHVRRMSRQLNVDAAVLYASSIIAESGPISSGRCLPGSVSGWRGQLRYYMHILNAVNKIYQQTASLDERIIGSVYTLPRFMRNIRVHIRWAL